MPAAVLILLTECAKQGAFCAKNQRVCLSSRISTAIYDSTMLFFSLCCIFTMLQKGDNMFYNVLNAKKMIDSSKMFEKMTLLEKDNSSLSLIAIKKEEIIDTHTSVCDAAVYLIEGKIELHFDAQMFTLEENDILMFKKDHQHKVRALMDSKFLLIKI